jgi:cell fate regulator YaaT (PSP1 superfamily)
MKFIGIARKFVNRGVILFDDKIDVERNTWVEVETELGMIPYRLIKPIDSSGEAVGTFSRILDKNEIELFDDLAEQEEEAFDRLRRGVEKYRIEMKPVAALITSDDQRIIFYFTAPERVDFRRLVRDLASEFDRVIRLQHVSSRIAAMIRGGIGPCGRKLCCHSGIVNQIDEIPSSLLRNQNLGGIDSSKLSGICDKLVCCLAYEDETYARLKEDLPEIGQIIKVESKKGEVIDINPFKRSVLVKLEDGAKKEVFLEK